MRVAQPVKNSSSNRQVAQDSDSDNEDMTPSRANKPGGGSPGQTGKPPALSTTSASRGGGHSTASLKQSSASGKTSVTGSQPSYATSQLPSARELALRATADQTRAAMEGKNPLRALKKIFKHAPEVRLMVPRNLRMDEKSDPYSQICEKKWLMQIQVRHLELRLDPCGPGDDSERLYQMTFVRNLLENFGALYSSGNTGVSIDLDVPMRSLATPSDSLGQVRTNSSNFWGAAEQMYSMNLYRTIAESKVIGRVRVNAYRLGLDKNTWLSKDDEILGANATISWLELADCALDDEVAGQLADALKGNTSIKTLVLNNCSMPEEGGAALARAFARRPDLKVVGFRPGPGASPAPHGSPMGNGGRTAIQHSASAVVASTGSAAKTPAVNTASSWTTTTTTTTTTTSGAKRSSSVTTSITSRPAGYFRTARFHSAHEQDLADAAAEAQAALKRDDPAPALRQLFNQRAAVRIDVPAKILWKVDDANGIGDGYEIFSTVKCLSRLKLRDIEFRPQPCQAGESQSCQFDFLAYTLDSLSQLPKTSLIGTSLAIVAPDTGTSEEVSGGTVRAQDGLFKSLCHDRLTARLDLGALAPRTEGSAALCRFFDSLPGKTRLVELRLCGAVLSRAETVALADGLRENKSLQVLDLTGALLDAGVRDRFHDALEDRPDLKVID
jgi:hypothetical protein